MPESCLRPPFAAASIPVAHTHRLESWPLYAFANPVFRRVYTWSHLHRGGGVKAVHISGSHCDAKLPKNILLGRHELGAASIGSI